MSLCIFNCDSRHPQSNILVSIPFIVEVQQARPSSLNLLYIKLNMKVICNMTQQLWLEFLVSHVPGGERV